MDCICSLDVSNALGQMVKLVGKVGVPDGFVFCHFCEMAIFKRLSSQFIDNGTNECLPGGMRSLCKFEHVRGHGVCCRILYTI